MLNIKDFVTENQDGLFGVPINTKLRKHRKRGKRLRAGWQTALGRTTPCKMSVPTILCNNVRSLFGKLPDLSYLLQLKEFRNSCVLCLQESWLNDSVDDSVVHLDDFACYRQDRDRCK